MKKYLLIIIILLIVIILGFFYTVFIYNVSNSDLVNWLNTLVSTIISVSFALIIALFILYHQANLVQEETKNKFFPLIEMVLLDIWKSLNDLKDPMKIKLANDKELVFQALIFQSTIFNQAVCANVFNSEETKILLTIIAEINFHNSLIDKLINLSTRSIIQPDELLKVLEFFYNNHTKTINKLKKSILSANQYFKFNKLNMEIKQNKSNTLE